MTSSDDTALSPHAIAEIARRVGVSHDGRAERAVRSPALRVGLACAKFNGAITERLVDGALRAFDKHGLPSDSLEVAWVPGAFELPLAAARMVAPGRIGAVVALGAVIRGDTAHFDYVAGPCADGLQRVALQTGRPVVFGVLTTEDVDQALARSGPGDDNKGYEAAVTAMEMVDLLAALESGPG
jgi:6,7-dimethyl-8-ribityllumazine synthase